MEIIRLVEGTDLPVRVTLRQLGVARSTFYGIWVISFSIYALMPDDVKRQLRALGYAD